MSRLVILLSVLVALLTTYILMLPGITMEYDMLCGLEEHQHTEACFAVKPVCGLEEQEPVTTETTQLICGISIHEHSNDCLNSAGERVCGIATEVFHTHNDFCYDGEGNRICTLKGNPRHEHTSECYEIESTLTCQLTETAGHVHTDACKSQIASVEPACGLAESAGHLHSDECRTSVLVCGIAESAGHLHEESCSLSELVQVCLLEENTEHTHGDGCFAPNTSLVCGKEEGEGAHVHTDACYTTEITCGIPEGDGAHTHSEACYPMVDTIICGMEAGEGAHTHTEACHTTQELLACSLLHKHSADCYQTDANGRECVICGYDEVPEHYHSASCCQVTVSTTEGHTHTEACNGSVPVCGLEEHVHEDACYPEDAVVVTATPSATEATVEPTATPSAAEATVEPTATPSATEATAEPTAAPSAAEPTAGPTPTPIPAAADEGYFCEMAEHRHSGTCLDATGVLICGYPCDHLHGELCLIDLTDAVFYCGVQEHLHGFLCFDENFNLTCGFDTEHRHSYDCLEDSASIIYHCGMAEHLHGELCYDENWHLVCSVEEHLHANDCRYACGKQEHIHTSSSGVMLLSLEETYGCYDAQGNLICSLEEHLHGEGCNTAQSAVAQQQNSLMTLEETAQTSGDFGDYVTGVTVLTESGNSSATYDLSTQTYTTAINIQFAIPEGKLQENGYQFVYNLPSTVSVNDSMLEKPFTITNEAEQQVGTFTILKDDDGNYYLNISFNDSLSDDACSGKLFFGCSISESAVNENGDIAIEFDKNNQFVIDSDQIDRSVLYSLSTDKAGGDYNAADNTLTYTISVKSKGTPDVIQINDNLWLSNAQIDSRTILSVQYKAPSSGGYTDVRQGEGGYTVTLNKYNKSEMGITLPQVIPTAEEAEYLITYQVKLVDMGFADVSWTANNTANVTSGSTSPNQVNASDSVNTSYTQDTLAKNGSYNSATDEITWTITFNTAGKVINGMTLTDEMFGLATGDLMVTTPDGTAASGYTIQTDDTGITGITFDGSDTTPNTNAYIITYTTKPQQDYVNYVSNKVTVKDTNNETKAGETGSVSIQQRPDQSVEKKITETQVDGSTVTLTWTVNIGIDADGLSNNVSINDSMGGGERHYLTFEQLKALYNQISGYLVQNDGQPVMQVKAFTDNINNAQQLNIQTVLNNDNTYANQLFQLQSFQLDADSVNKQVTDRPGTLSFTYTTTVNTADLTQQTQFNNWINVGSFSASDTYTFLPEVTNPVTKHCGDGCSADGTCNGYHYNSDQFSWAVKVYQKGTYEYLTMEDILPGDAELLYVCLANDQNVKLTYTPSNATEAVALTPENAIGNGLLLNGTYDPNTGKISVKIQEDSDSNTTAYQYGEGKTLELKVYARLKDDARPAPGTNQQYQLKNQVTVFTPDNATYGTDDYTYVLNASTPYPIVKTNMQWASGESTVEYQANNFGWIVKLNQDREYEKLVVTDTLPDGLTLYQLKVGNSVIPVTINDDGTIEYSLDNINQSEKGLDLQFAYDAATRKLTLTIARKAGEDGSNGAYTNGYGANKQLYVYYYFTIPEDSLTSGEELSYTNTADSSFETQGSDPVTGTSTQTQKVTFKPPVTKYGPDGRGGNTTSDSTIVNANGKLVWKVKVYQSKAYDSITIVDQLPAGIVELDSERYDGRVIAIGDSEHAQYWFQLGSSSDGGTTYPLICVNQYNNNTPVASSLYSASYNAQTGAITITFNGDINGQFGFGENKDLWLTYYCKVTDEYMPNTEDGQYTKELGALTNHVTVTVNESEPLGVAAQTQNVTIEKEKPTFTTVVKDSPEYADAEKVLHYQVDINPTQQDMDPAKSSVTVVDTVGYSKSQSGIDGLSADRKLTLKPDTVKLYFADYDENGLPLLDEQGRLVIGEEVDPSQWAMEYTEKENGDWSERLITLSVPDERALILVYDYQVSMTNGTQSSMIGSIPLSINNTVKVEGYANGDSAETSTNDKWNFQFAGGNTEVSSLTLIKHDAANLSNVLAGVAFVVEKYEDGVWSELATLTTDAEGKVKLTKADYSANTLYRITETATITGYVQPDTQPEYYFYWASSTEGEATTVVVPEDFDLSTAINLEANAQTLYVANDRQATTLGVEKVWKYANGSLMSDRDKPSSVTVELHRYAIPEDEWKILLDKTDGQINGALVDGGENTTVTIQISSLNVSPDQYVTATTNALVGSTLQFDVYVKHYGIGTNDDWGGFYPSFDGITHTAYQVIQGSDGNWDCYHYEVPVAGNGSINGVFYNGDHVWGGDISQYVEITNINAPTGLPSDNSAFASQLQPYVDRSYVQSMKLTSASNWQAMWDNLPLEGEVANADGTTTRVHYKYYVTETAPDGYSATIGGYSSDDGGSFTVENTKDGSSTATTNLRIYKQWYDSNGNQFTYDQENDWWSGANGARYAYREGKWNTVGSDDTLSEIPESESNLLSQLPLPSVSIRLLRKDLMAGEDAPWVPFSYNQNPSTVINANTNWMYNFVNLPLRVYNSSGQPVESYDYFIEELDQGNFTVELVESGTETDNGRQYEVITVKNSAVRNVDISVKKQWADGVKPDDVNNVTVVLSRWIYTEDGYVEDDTFAEVAAENGWLTEVTLPQDNNWTYKWTGLPNGETDDNGETKSYSYVVTETKVNGTPIEQTLYQPTYSHEGGRVPANGTLIITNGTASTTTAISVEKVWQDAGGMATEAPEGVESVTVQLKRRADTENAVEEIVSGYDAIELNETNSWCVTINGLDKFVLDENNNPTATPYIYYFKEVNAPEGYTVSYSNIAEDGTITAPTDGKVTVTNTANGSTTIQAVKLWKDSDGNKLATPPANVTVQLYRNTLTQEQWEQFVSEQQQTEQPGDGGDTGDTGDDGGSDDTGDGGDTGGDTGDSGTGSGETVTLTFVLGQNGNIWGSLKYECPIGEDITLRLMYVGSGSLYTIGMGSNWWNGDQTTPWIDIVLSSNDTQINSEYNVTANAYETAIDVWTITLPPTSPTQYSLQRSTTTDWTQTGNPTATPVGDPVILSAANSWNYTWPLQPDGDDTNYYYYYVKETATPSGYEATYSYTYDETTKTYAYQVTNTRSASAPTVGSLTVTKAWQDGDGNSSTAPDTTVTFKLMRSIEGGEATQYPDDETTYQLNTANGWSTTIPNLPLYDENGNPYLYQVVEDAVDGYMTIIEPATVTLTTSENNTGSVIITNRANRVGSLTVKKEWVNASASNVSFNLYRIARPKDSPEPVNYVPVTFTIKPPYGDGTPFSSRTAYFPENAVVTWKPTWTYRGGWHPSNSNVTDEHPQTNSVTYNGSGNYFNETQQSDGKWYEYSFALGSIGTGGTALWTTDRSGYEDNTKTTGTVFTTHYWTHAFELDNEKGKELVYTYSIANDLTIPNLVFEDAENTYRYVLEEVTSGYTVSYDYYSSSPTQQHATIINYNPQKVKLKAVKQWYDADDKETTPPNGYYITYKLWFGTNDENKWVHEEGRLSLNDDKWELTFDDIIDEGHKMYIEETGVYRGDKTEVTGMYNVQYSVDGTTWYDATGIGTALHVTPTNQTETTFYIRNTLKPTYILPETGGRGTQWYTGAGVLLIGIALGLLYKTNKMRKRRADA